MIYGFLVLIGVVLLIFALFKLMPDPARLTQGQRTDVASLEAIRKAEHLDKHWLVQFQYYINDLSPLSFYEDTEKNRKEYGFVPLVGIGETSLVLKAPYLRRSYQSQKKVVDILLEALPTTVILGLTAILFATIIGVILGVFAALKQFTWIDNSILATSVIGISQPSYFSGAILALVFGYMLSDWTGLSHIGDLFVTDDLGDETYFEWKNLILPALALGIRPIAIIVQLTRSSMLDVLGQDYIRTAYAKGLRGRVVIFKHALRNALNPVVTAVSGWLASILAGAFFIEVIFNLNGLGKVTILALQNLDVPVVMGAVLLTATVFVTVNILVDLLYGVLDPRVSVKS